MEEIAEAGKAPVAAARHRVGITVRVGVDTIFLGNNSTMRLFKGLGLALPVIIVGAAEHPAESIADL